MEVSQKLVGDGNLILLIMIGLCFSLLFVRALLDSVQLGLPKVTSFLLSDATFDPRFDNDVVARSITKVAANEESLDNLLNHPSFKFDYATDEGLMREMVKGSLSSDSVALFSKLWLDHRFAFVQTEKNQWLEKAVTDSKLNVLSFMIRRARVPITRKIWALAKEKGDTNVLNILAPALTPVNGTNIDPNLHLTHEINDDEKDNNPSSEDSLPSTTPKVDSSSNHPKDPLSLLVKGLPFLVSFLLLI